MPLKAKLIIHLVGIAVIILGSIFLTIGYFRKSNNDLRERSKLIEKQFIKAQSALTDARATSKELEERLGKALASARRVEKEAERLRETNNGLRERIAGLEGSIRGILDSVAGAEGTVGEFADIIRHSLAIIQSISR